MAEILFLHLVVKGKPVVGEAVMKGFKGQIELSAMSWAVKSRHKEKDGDETVAKATVAPQPFKLTKSYDRATNLLCRYMDTRTEFDSATITMLSATVWGAEKKHLPLMVAQLGRGYVEDVSLEVSPSGKSMAVKETLTLSYRHSKIEYYPGDLSKGRPKPMTFEMATHSIGLPET